MAHAKQLDAHGSLVTPIVNTTIQVEIVAKCGGKITQTNIDGVGLLIVLKSHLILNLPMP